MDMVSQAGGMALKAQFPFPVFCPPAPMSRFTTTPRNTRKSLAWAAHVLPAGRHSHQSVFCAWRHPDFIRRQSGRCWTGAVIHIGLQLSAHDLNSYILPFSLASDYKPRLLACVILRKGAKVVISSEWLCFRGDEGGRPAVETGHRADNHQSAMAQQG